MDNHEKVVTLEVISWGFSLGGEHFTGSISGYTTSDYKSDGSDYQIICINHNLTAKEAKNLNKKDQARGGGYYNPGSKSDRFETRADLEREAVKQYKKHFPKALALNVGTAACANPQRVLDGPSEFMKATNDLVQEQEKCGGYEKNSKKMEQILKKYTKILQKL